MKSFLVFVQKEFTEQIRTYKALVFGVILLIFGIASPLLAKLTPEMFKMMDVGFEINLPDPTSADAFAQFFKNIGQMVFIVMILIFSSSVVHEKVTGTGIMMLTKKLSRPGFILAKFVSATTVWTIFYTLSALACVFYTNILFPQADGNIKETYVALAMLSIWLYGVLLLAASTFASTLSNNQSIATVGSFAIWFFFVISGSIPKIKDYTPALLSSKTMEIYTGAATLNDMSIPIFLCFVLIIGLVTAACMAFSHQEI